MSSQFIPGKCYTLSWRGGPSIYIHVLSRENMMRFIYSPTGELRRAKIRRKGDHEEVTVQSNSSRQKFTFSSRSPITIADDGTVVRDEVKEEDVWTPELIATDIRNEPEESAEPEEPEKTEEPEEQEEVMTDDRMIKIVLQLWNVPERISDLAELAIEERFGAAPHWRQTGEKCIDIMAGLGFTFLTVETDTVVCDWELSGLFDTLTELMPKATFALWMETPEGARLLGWEGWR